mgnify:CR=1 FL=1
MFCKKREQELVKKRGDVTIMNSMCSGVTYHEQELSCSKCGATFTLNYYQLCCPYCGTEYIPHTTSIFCI